MTFEEMDAFIAEHEDIVCPVLRQAQLYAHPQVQPHVQNRPSALPRTPPSTCYLRPETAQGIFVNFSNIQRTTRRKLPFGVCQVGKAFRNEITPGNFTFRTREFEQMELRILLQARHGPRMVCLLERLLQELAAEPRHQGRESPAARPRAGGAFASIPTPRPTSNILFPFGWGELWGIADRTDYDLKRASGARPARILRISTRKRTSTTFRTVIEPSLGADRVALAFLCDAYDEEVVDEAKNDVRTVLHLHPALAPFKCAVLPLSKKLAPAATELYHELQKEFMVDYDDAGSIGKRYRREDEIGTPYCITVDFQTVGDEKTPADGCVTVRERDSMEQVRIPIAEVKSYIAERVKF